MPVTTFSFLPAAKARKQEIPVIPAGGRIPRISRIMALAIHLKHLVDQGQMRSFSEIAGLGHVSRARVTQIMDLNMLAPDIQEDILFLPPMEKNRDPWSERNIRAITYEMCWDEQRKLWKELVRVEKAKISAAQ